MDKKDVVSFQFNQWCPVDFSQSVVSDSLQPHGLQHTRLPCPSPTLRACSNSCPSSQWCHPITSSSVALFSFCLQYTLLLLLLLSRFTRVGLFATPWTAAYQPPLYTGFSRQEYWSGVPLPSPISTTDSYNFTGPWKVGECSILTSIFSLSFDFFPPVNMYFFYN